MPSKIKVPLTPQLGELFEISPLDAKYVTPHRAPRHRAMIHIYLTIFMAAEKRPQCSLRLSYLNFYAISAALYGRKDCQKKG